MPDTSQTKDVWTGLSDELANDFKLIAIRIDSASEASVIAEAIQRYRPAGLVLMNNPTVAAYREYQRQGGPRAFPPAVVVMTSFLEHRSAELVQTTGISYEVPLITAMTNLRRLLALPAERVGVVVRVSLRRFVKRQIALASRERIIVDEEVVSHNPNASEVKRAIRRLKQRVNVIWILNDNHLLSPSLIADAWLPGLDERPWLPTIVGAASLVSAKKSFGTFAVLPDHTALGAQAGSMMLDIASNGWRVTEDVEVQLPLSTTTTIDLVQTKERFVLQPGALDQVDRILE
jgi:ABC-type uncharacterized transport system substrate-binding protein